jgi:hypothetical protein
VGTTEELLARKSSGSCLEDREYGRRDPSHWRRDSLYQQRVGINFADKRRSLSSFADSGHGAQLRFTAGSRVAVPLATEDASSPLKDAAAEAWQEAWAEPEPEPEQRQWRISRERTAPHPHGALPLYRPSTGSLAHEGVIAVATFLVPAPTRRKGPGRGNKLMS